MLFNVWLKSKDRNLWCLSLQNSWLFFFYYGIFHDPIQWQEYSLEFSQPNGRIFATKALFLLIGLIAKMST
jgi:hypothetical protein